MDGTPAAVDGRAALKRWPLLVVALVGCACGCLAIGEHTRAITFSLLATSVVVIAKPEWRLGSSRQRVRRRLPLNEAFAGSLQKLHTKPPIYSCADFISPAECDALISLASPHLVASTAGGNVESHGRTSKSCMLSRSRAESKALLARCAELTGHPAAHHEDPQISRYLDGEFYEPHLDAPDRSDSDGKGFRRCGGTRLATVLVYLNDVAQGGETRFTKLGSPSSRLVQRPQKGKAILFFPASPSGKADTRLEHEARPPREGETKWVAQVWLRQRVDPTRTFIDNPHSV